MVHVRARRLLPLSASGLPTHLVKLGVLGRRSGRAASTPVLATTAVTDSYWSGIDVPYLPYETWDRRGYPRGLKREQITSFARMLHVLSVDDCAATAPMSAWTNKKCAGHILATDREHTSLGVIVVI
jgi:hypothetical protein